MPSEPSSAWPPSEGLSTVNVPRQEATLTIKASTVIQAPAALVFDVLLRVGEFQNWNSFSPSVHIEQQPQDATNSDMLSKGSKFTLYAIMDAKKPSKTTPTQLLVTDISTPSHPSDYIPQSFLESDASYTSDLSRVHRISWRCEGGFVARGLKTERFHEIIALGENECEVRTWENQGGVLAHTVKWMYNKTLQEKFALWCSDLKKYSEEKATQAAPSGDAN